MLFHIQEMSKPNPPSQDCALDEEEDYINMELISSNSSPQSREFEFQMSQSFTEKETNTFFPADDLFYKGKLLPLLLPSRRQMLQNLTTRFDFTKMPFEEQDHNYYYSMPSTNTFNTPLDSCNISPSESCRVSCELNPDDYFFEWSTELSSFVHNTTTNHLCAKKPWSKKLKLIQKLKASRAYLKSLFTKSACSDESNCNSRPQKLPISKSSNEYLKIAKKKPTIAAIMKGIDKDGIDDNNNNNNVHRSSFSGAIKRHSPVKCLSSSSSNSSSIASSSSSSFSINSGGLNELRRSSSATEIEGSIEAAIDHCKRSQHMFESRIGDQNRQGVCSI